MPYAVLAGIFEYANRTIYLYYFVVPCTPITFAHRLHGTRIVWMPCVPYSWINLCERIFFFLCGVLQQKGNVRHTEFFFFIFSLFFFAGDEKYTHFFCCCADFFLILCRCDALQAKSMRMNISPHHIRIHQHMYALNFNVLSVSYFIFVAI